jgi:hypothetical protein
MTDPIYRDLLCTIPSDRRETVVGEHLEACQQLAELELAKTSFAAAHAAKVKDLKAKEAHLRDLARTGKELRPVECRRNLDPNRRCVEIIRLDTYQVVDERAMTEEEIADTLQPELPGVTTFSADAPDLPHAIWCKSKDAEPCNCMPPASAPVDASPVTPPPAASPKAFAEAVATGVLPDAAPPKDAGFKPAKRERAKKNGIPAADSAPQAFEEDEAR